MNKVYLILTCIIAAGAVPTSQECCGPVLIDIYNDQLNFLDSFLSSSEIDNLHMSQENISLNTISTLRGTAISYTSLRGEITSWCSEVQISADVVDLSPESLNRFTSSVFKELKNIGKHLNMIPTNDNNLKYQAIITFDGEVRKLEIIYGQTPNNVESLLLPLLTRSKIEGNVIENVKLKSFNSKMEHAKKIVAEASNTICNQTNVNFNNEEMLTKCALFQKILNTKRTTPIPVLRIIPSTKDNLKAVPNACTGEYNKNWKTQCDAILSKSTMDQLLKLYRNDSVVNNFFSEIRSSGSRQCDNRIKTFIKNFSLDWIYQVSNMDYNQFLKISICLDSDSRAHVSIVY